MSEPIPESIPTSADPRSHRPVKKARGNASQNLAALSAQARAIATLFVDPERTSVANLPPPTSSSSSQNRSALPPPPEIVPNVQGSSAGAGSGEFHVYKASRRREYERLRLMAEDARRDEEEGRWALEEEARRIADEERTRKNREKRLKKKGKKGKRNNKKSVDGGEDESEDGDEVEGARSTAAAAGGDDDGEVALTSAETQPANGVKGASKPPKREMHDIGLAKIAEENGVIIQDDD